MLSISHLHVTIGEKPTVKGLTLDASACEVNAVMGPEPGCAGDFMAGRVG